MRNSKWMKRLVAVLVLAAMLVSCVPALADNPSAPNTFMVIRTGNSGKLNLRALPTTASESLGLYSNGTVVLVETASNGWAYVSVNGRHGYMATQFLAKMSDGSGTSSGTVMYVKTGNSGKLNLRVGASLQTGSLGLYPNGTKVLMIQRIGDWAYVNVNGMRGYMMYKFLSYDGSVTPVVPTVDPTKAVSMVVKTGNSGKLNLRESPSLGARSLGLYANGTVLSAVSVGNGWHWVTVNGRTGYMMSQFLADNSSAPVTPVTPTSPYTMYIRTGNSGKLNLRALPTTDSASLGLYPNDLAVTVLATTGAWANVAVDGKMGYMMLQFLTTTAPGGGTTPIPVTPGTAVVRQPSNSYVNLRSSQNSEINNVIAQVPSGTVVTVLSWGNVWCQIRLANGQEGFMVAHYLEKQ